MDSNNEFFQHFAEQPFHKYLGMTIGEIRIMRGFEKKTGTPQV